MVRIRRPARLPFSSWKTKPRHGEPAHGYFTQLVGEGYHASARVYANEMEINGRNIVMKEMLDELLRLPLADEHKESLVRWTPIWDGTFHRLAGETLRKRQMSFYDRRFCRGCLAEAPYHRVWWDIVEFNVCPFHAEPLENKTLRGGTIKWWYPSFQTAPDGEALRRNIPQLHEPDDFEWYVVSRLGCAECYERPLLDPAPLHEVIDLCGAVGRILANPWSRVAPEAGREDCRVGFHALSGSLEDLESAFVTWLETNVPEKERKRGIQHGYGWFQRRGDSNFFEAALWPEVNAAMRKAFARTGRIGRQSTGVETLTHSESTIKEAALAIGMDVRGLRAIAQQIGLAVKDPNPAMRAFLTPEQVATLYATAWDLINVKEAARRLGCSQPCVRDLVSSGLLKGFQQTRIFGHEGHGLSLLGSEVDALLQRVLNMQIAVGRGQQHGMFYLSRALGKKESDIVLAVLAGEMAVVNIDRRRKGIASWRFEAVDNKTAFRRRVGEDEVRLIEAGAVMRMGTDVISLFVRAGVIKSRIGEDGQTYLDRTSFDAFSSKYVNAKAYMDRLGCTEFYLGAKLQELGIRRCHSKIRGRYEIYLVDRKALENVVGNLDGDGDPDLWNAFRGEMTRICASFVIPPASGGQVVKAYTATRSTFVELHPDGRMLKIRKTFQNRTARREWKVFIANQQRIRHEWKAFKWSKLNARGDVTAEFTIRNVDDIPVAAEALRCLYLHFRNPRKLPQG
jgi:hypothetical protein